MLPHYTLMCLYAI